MLVASIRSLTILRFGISQLYRCVTLRLLQRGQEQAFTRQLDALRRKIASATEVVESKSSIVAEAESKSSELQSRLDKEERRVAKIHTETAKLTVLESDANNREVLASLRTLVSMNESLKSQEGAFKSSCALQRTEYLSQLARLSPGGAAGAGGEGGDEDEETIRMRAVETMHARESETLNKIRRILAKKNQELALLRRRIDEVPTRAELLQFQYRFSELAELSQNKHLETKKFYSMYNALSASCEFMHTEVKLLNSIIEGFPSSILKGSNASRSEFLTRFETIIAGVEGNKQHVLSEIATTENEKQEMMKKYMSIVDAQRLYAKLKKEFKEESLRNEKLNDAKEEIERREAEEQ
jgi:hypothetical protein